MPIAWIEVVSSCGMQTVTDGASGTMAELVVGHSAEGISAGCRGMCASATCRIAENLTALFRRVVGLVRK